MTNSDGCVVHQSSIISHLSLDIQHSRHGSLLPGGAVLIRSAADFAQPSPIATPPLLPEFFGTTNNSARNKAGQ